MQCRGVTLEENSKTFRNRIRRRRWHSWIGRSWGSRSYIYNDWWGQSSKILCKLALCRQPRSTFWSCNWQVVEEKGPVQTLPESGGPEDDIQEIDPLETITFNCKDDLFQLCTLLTAVLAALLPEWTSYSLHPKLLHVLHKKCFTAPTPIQAAVLPLASKNRDIIGVAQTVRFISILGIDISLSSGLRKNTSIWLTYP